MPFQKPVFGFQQPLSKGKRTPTREEVAERLATFAGFETLSHKDKLLLVQLGNLPKPRMVRFDTWRSNIGEPYAYNLQWNPTVDAGIIPELRRIFTNADITKGMKQKYGQYIMFGKHNARLDDPRCVEGTRIMCDKTDVCVECEGVLFNPIIDTLAFEHWRDMTFCLMSCQEDLHHLRKIRIYYKVTNVGSKLMLDLQALLECAWELFQQCPKMETVNLHLVHHETRAWDVKMTLDTPEFIDAFNMTREKIGMTDSNKRNADAATQRRWIRSMKVTSANALPPDMPSLRWHLQKMYYLQAVSRRLKDPKLMRERDLDREVEHLEGLTKQELSESFRSY